MRNAAIEYKTRCNPLTQEKGALYRSDFVRLSGEEKATDYSILPQLGSGRCRMVLDGIGVVFYKGAERLEALVLEKLAAQIRNLALPFSYGFQHTRGLIPRISRVSAGVATSLPKHLTAWTACSTSFTLVARIF